MPAFWGARTSGLELEVAFCGVIFILFCVLFVSPGCVESAAYGQHHVKSWSIDFYSFSVLELSSWPL